MHPSKIKLADWAAHNTKSVLEKMLSDLSDPQTISFALGLPAAELFPADAFAVCYRRILQRNQLSLQYQPPLSELKEKIVRLMRQRGVETSVKNIFLTAGAQQGANLLTHLLLNFGGETILEEKTYTGFQQVLKPFATRIHVIESDSEAGFDIEALAGLLTKGIRPSFFYTVCDGHNPLSLNLSLSCRNRLIELARAHQFPIIEDDPYGFLNYDDPPLPPLVALDPENVLYVGTFSKILAPGLRTGWLIVPEELTGHLGSLKEAADINTSPLSQHLINEFFETGAFEPHLQRLKDEYRTRRNAMNGALTACFQNFARWKVPANGLFMWLELTAEIDTGKLLEQALSNQKVAFIPGHSFNVTDSGRGANCLRLNFTNNSPVRIYEGLERLAYCVKEFV